MKKLAIFDLDGTLYDTEKVNFSAYQKALDEIGVALEEDYFIHYCDGHHYKSFLPKLVGDFEGEELEKMVEKVHNQKKKYYSDFLRLVRENEMLFDLISKIKDSYHIAMVTTASRRNVEEILSFSNRRELFDLVICQEDVNVSKPDPEGFLKAMEYFQVNRKDTMIFEDSEVGMTAALGSGANIMRVCRF